MPSIAVQSARATISAATARGRLTVDSNAYLFPGANAWVWTSNGTTARTRVKILACIGTDTVLVRAWPTKKDPDGVSYAQENYGPPSYGLTDMTAYNGSAFISMESQSVPVDPTYAKRVVP